MAEQGQLVLETGRLALHLLLALALLLLSEEQGETARVLQPDLVELAHTRVRAGTLAARRRLTLALVLALAAAQPAAEPAQAQTQTEAQP